MLEGIVNGIRDVVGDGITSLLESILKLLVFRLFYYLEKALCWLVGILMELFEVFAGLEPVTYDGREDYLINIFFSNKAISNIYWGMAIIGMILIFVFAGWAVIRKLFDAEGKQQQSLGQIIWGAVKSLFLIIGLTLVVNVVIYATSVLMRQVDYIFNNAYHLDQPMEREFTDEEYAAMGRILATVGNYSMISTANNRYNINLCFNDIRTDMLFLQDQGVFRYSYYKKEGDKVIESWQSVIAKIAKSADLTRDLKIDVYNDSVASAITYAMEYLRNTSNPQPLSRIEASYTVTERAHLDRMIFLLGTFRAAKNEEFNTHAAFDDPLRGPYFYEQDRSIYNYDQVDEDFDIGFKTDYILVWFAAVAIIFNLVIIILNCVARIFNLLLLYIIAPPFIAASPLDNGGKFKQWTTAFIIQSLSVFGTVIAMQLLLIYLPIVASPELVLFKDRPLMNAIAQFMLVFGGIEAAKKAGSLVTGILADQAGMEAIRSGDMSGAASRMISTATSAGRATLGAAMGVAGFALKPVTNTISRPFKSAADWWKKLGTGGRQQRAEKSVQDEIARNKEAERLRKSGDPDAKYLNGGSSNSDKTQPQPEDKKTSTNEGEGPKPPPPVPRGDPHKAGRSFDSNDARRSQPKKGGEMANLRQRGGFDRPPASKAPTRDSTATSNRPSLDTPPRQAPGPQGGGRRGGGPQGGGQQGGGPQGGGPQGGGGAGSLNRRALSQNDARRGNENNSPERRPDNPPERNRQNDVRQNDARQNNDRQNDNRQNNYRQNENRQSDNRQNNNRQNDVRQNNYRQNNDRQSDDRRNRFDRPRNENTNNIRRVDPRNDLNNARNNNQNNNRNNNLGNPGRQDPIPPPPRPRRGSVPDLPRNQNRRGE